MAAFRAIDEAARQLELYTARLMEIKGCYGRGDKASLGTRPCSVRPCTLRHRLTPEERKTPDVKREASNIKPH